LIVLKTVLLSSSSPQQNCRLHLPKTAFETSYHPSWFGLLCVPRLSPVPRGLFLSSSRPHGVFMRSRTLLTSECSHSRRARRSVAATPQHTGNRDCHPVHSTRPSEVDVPESYARDLGCHARRFGKCVLFGQGLDLVAVSLVVLSCRHWLVYRLIKSRKPLIGHSMLLPLASTITPGTLYANPWAEWLLETHGLPIGLRQTSDIDRYTT
jgi:hypothetical protein